MLKIRKNKMTVNSFIHATAHELDLLSQQIGHNLDRRYMHNQHLEESTQYEKHINRLDQRLTEYQQKMVQKDMEINLLLAKLHEIESKLQAEQALSYELHKELKKQSQEATTYQTVLKRINGGTQVISLVHNEIKKHGAQKIKLT